MELVMYLLDTSVIIDAIRIYRLKAEKHLREKYGKGINICILTIAELYAGQTAQDPDIETFIDYLVDSFAVPSADTKTAVYAGKLRCLYGVDIADAFIASTAILNDLTLVSHNIKHFSKIKNLKLEMPNA